jgi:hypothetical protein
MAINKAKIAAAKERLKDHPGGDNLKMITDSNKAREYQKRSVEARKRNKERVQDLRTFWKDFDRAGLGLESDQNVKGVDVIEFLMKKAFMDEDFELAGMYAEKLAQYQTPKLASQQVTNTNIDLKDLSDEEFQKELEKLEELNSKGNPE